MSAAPFMQLYVGDYLADTLDLTTEQHGAYLLLLMTMWRHGARLPNDPSKLARIARVSARRWHLVWPEIQHFFYVDGDDVRNKRLDREHQKAVSISEKRSASGAKGGAAKVLKSINSDVANASDLLKHSQISDIIKEKEEANASSKKRGSRLPPDWRLPKACGEWAVSEGLSGADTRIEGEKFKDYWTGLAGSKGVKLDWQATWRNWVRKAIADRQKPGFRSIQGDKPQWPEGSLRTQSPTRVQAFWGGHWENTNDYTADEAERHRLFVGRAPAYANA